MIIDGHHLMFRAFYATPPMQTSKGEHSNMIYGFASMLLNILAVENPTHIALTFDKGKSFRHDEYPEYKAGRSETPEELKSQMPKIYEMVEIMGITQFWTEGFEADDMIGTLANLSIQEDEEIHAMLISGDKDLLQLVEERITLAIPHKGSRAPEYFSPNEVFNKLGITPEQVPDYKGLVGDASDNIKGVKGIGPKGAEKLLQEYETLENIYKNIENITGSTKTKLEDDEKSAHYSRYLATIIKNVPVEFSLEQEKFVGLSPETVEFFQTMEFASLQRRVMNYIQKDKLHTLAHDVFSNTQSDTKKEAPKEDNQMSLF